MQARLYKQPTTHSYFYFLLVQHPVVYNVFLKKNIIRDWSTVSCNSVCSFVELHSASSLIETRLHITYYIQTQSGLEYQKFDYLVVVVSYPLPVLTSIRYMFGGSKHTPLFEDPNVLSYTRLDRMQYGCVIVLTEQLCILI